MDIILLAFRFLCNWSLRNKIKRRNQSSIWRLTDESHSAFNFLESKSTDARCAWKQKQLNDDCSLQKIKMTRRQTKTIELGSQNMNFCGSKEKTRNKGIGHEFEALKMASSTNYSLFILDFRKNIAPRIHLQKIRDNNVVVKEIKQSKISRWVSRSPVYEIRQQWKIDR